MELPYSLKTVPNPDHKDLTLEQLIEERQYWNYKITSATGWGASLAAASEFRDDCDRELLRRFT